MTSLGFGHDTGTTRPSPRRSTPSRVRSRNDADWAFVLYVVDSLQDSDGMFANGVVAYTADLFGPYCMLTYDNDGYQFANFDAVLAHEMGHVFGALDEYEPPAAGYPSTGDLTSGYLGVRNGNAVVGGNGGAQPCIMLGSNGTLAAFRDGDLCRWTRGQTGLRDSDADTRPDVVDTRPALATRLESTAAGGAVTPARHRRRAAAQARPHQRRRVLPPRPQHPRAARCAVQGGRRRVAAAHGGRRGVRRAVGGVDADHGPAHARRATSWSSRRRPGRRPAAPGSSGPATRPWTSSSPPTRRSRRPTATVKAGRKARVYVRSTSAGLPVSRLTPVKLVRVADGRVMTTLTTGENGVWTGTITPARTRAYEVRFAGAGQFLGPSASGRVTVKVR